MAQKWEMRDEDWALFARDIDSFLPDRIFDAHAHLYDRSNFPEGGWNEHVGGGPDSMGLAEYRQFIRWIHGERQTDGLFFGIAFLGDRKGENAFISRQVAEDSNALGEMLIYPTDDPEYVRQEVKRLKLVGLKPYHTMSASKPTWHADIETFLPESLVKVAHEEGLSITLHMVKDRAMADPANQATIRRYCETYPNMKMILAHAARGFNPWHTIEGIGALKGIDNVWCDTSAVTEAGAFEAIIETLGHTRLLYGSDFFVSHTRGRCVAIGDSFHWFYEDTLEKQEKHTKLKPVLVGLESLRALKLAALRMHLTDSQIEDIFDRNARQLFNLA